MEAPERPRLDKIAYCCSCGLTTHHNRAREDEPFKCVFCGAVEKKKSGKEKEHGT
jgi:hypothetical protein